MIEHKDECYSLYPQSGGGMNAEFKESVCNRGKIYKEASVLVETLQGYVYACSTFYEKSYKHSMLRMIKDGKVHYRTFDKFYTTRGLVTKAKQFAKDLFNQPGKDIKGDV